MKLGWATPALASENGLERRRQEKSSIFSNGFLHIPEMAFNISKKHNYMLMGFLRTE